MCMGPQGPCPSSTLFFGNTLPFVLKASCEELWEIERIVRCSFCLQKVLIKEINGKLSEC